MRGHSFLTLLAAVGAALLAAAACAPAAEPAKTTQPAAAPQAEASKPKPEAKTEAKPEVKEVAKSSVPPGEVEAKHGGVVNMSDQDYPGNIVWEEAVGTAFWVLYPQLNNVVQYQIWGDYAKGDHWNIVGDLAKSWEQSPDGLRWTFRLNDGIKFSDGQPFTCTDAKWSLDTIRTGKDLRRSPRALHFRVVDSIACADNLTMVVTLKRPQPGFLSLLAGGTNTIYPQHAYEGEASFAKFRADPKQVGTGPFILTEFLPGEKWVLRRNADYWKKPYPYIDGINILNIASSARPAALRAGRIDMLGGYSNAFTGQDQLLRECKDCQFGTRYTSIGFTPMDINHQRPPWNTPEVKDALLYAIDKKKHAQVCRGGWAAYDAAFLHPETSFALPRERLAKLPGYNFDDPEGNKAKAREILAKAGYKPGDLSITVTFQVGAASVPCYQEDIEAIGITFKPILLEVARHYDVRTAGDFDMQEGGYLTVSADPDATFYEYFYTGSDRNYGRYSNSEVDRLIDLQSQTLDFERRKGLVWQIQETLIRDAARLPVTISQVLPVTGPRVRNYLNGPTCGAQGTCARLERIWLEQGK